MITYPNNDYTEHWYRLDTHQYLHDRMLNLVIQANWNKRVICGFYLSPNDLEIHKNRFSQYLTSLDGIAEQMKLVDIHYDEKRINKIKTILTKIMNYEN